MSRVITKHERARLMANMTREKAAEAIPSSVSNIKRIEYRQQKPTPEFEKAMAKAYNAPWVADPSTPEDYEPSTKTAAAINYIDKRRKVDTVMPLATEILADGIVDETEKEPFKDIKCKVDDERRAGRDFLYAQ